MNTHRRTTPSSLLPGLLALAGLGLAAAPAHAQPASPPPPSSGALFYFYGYVAPEGSMTAEGATTPALYLFWGSDDAELATLGAGDTLTLKKDGQVVVGPFSFGATQSEAEIAALYAAPSQSRRLAETLYALDTMSPLDPPVTPATFAHRLWVALSGNCPPDQAATCRAFRDSRARLDVNVAIATYGAFRAPAPSAIATYELMATGPGGTRTLGTLVIDPSTAKVRIGAPTQAADVSMEQQRCDTPSLKEQGVLALSWDGPSVAKSVEPIARHNLVGYHAFASAGACDETAAPTELAALAAGVPHDTHGGFVLPGLARLTESLAPAAALPPVDPTTGRRLGPDPLQGWTTPLGNGYANPTTPGWRPTFSQLKVPAATVSAAGFQPGQRVCVRIAAVDRAGQLGATTQLTAEVADYAKPPSPWDVDVDLDSRRTWDDANGVYVDHDTLGLSWPAMEVSTWLARDASVACNPADAANSGRVVSAPDAAACGVAADRSEAYLAIDKYLVYVFADQTQVGGFFDNDGDGRDDRAERPASGDDPGTACDANAGTAPSHLLASIDAASVPVDAATGKRIVRFVDDVPAAQRPLGILNPAEQKGQVIWYAVAARGKDGWVGPLSAPVRGFYPNKSAIDRPDLDQVTFGVCAPELGPTELFTGPPLVALDETDERLAKGAKLRLYCLGSPKLIDDPIMRRVDGYVGEAPFTSVKSSAPFVSTDDPAADALVDLLHIRYREAPCKVYAEVVDPNGRVVAASDPSEDLVTFADERSLELAILLTDGCTTTSATPIQPGQIIDGSIHIGLPPGTPPDTCAELSLAFGDTSYRLKTICGAETLDYALPDNGGELMCFSLTFHGGNQVSTPPLDLPCVKAKTTIAPGPPLLKALSLPYEKTHGSIAWKGPGSPIAGVVVELSETTTGVFRSEFFPAGAAADPDGFMTGALPLGSPDGALLPEGASENWCVRARSLSAASTSDAGGLMSDWAGPICGSRVGPGTTLPSYLPWPSTSEPPTRATKYQAGYLGADGLPYVLIGSFDPKAVWPDPAPGTGQACGDCGVEELPTCYTDVPISNGPSCAVPKENAHSLCIDMCQLAVAAAGDFQRVVGYRQTWDAATQAWGPWLQVTPYLERAFCFVDYFSSHWDRCREREGPNQDVVAFGLMDPSFVMARFKTDPDALDGDASYRLAWIDRYPHEPGTKIRYEFMRFGPEGRIAEILPSTEVDIPSEVAP